MFKNAVSHCPQCTNTLYWDDQYRPWLLKSAIGNTPACQKTGCTLVVTNIAEEGCNSGKYSLIRLALIQSGISEESTDIALEALSIGYEAKAA
jgi:hypothetical protein